MRSDRLFDHLLRSSIALLLVPATLLVGLPLHAAPPETETETDAVFPGDEPNPERPIEPAIEPPPEAPEPEPEPPAPDPSEDAGKSAPQLFAEGQDAYALGHYAVAIAKFEHAFELSGAPALLFNIGQGYWQWHAVDADVEHLRRARKLFQNYDDLMRGDEGYDPAEVKAILAAIDAQLEAANQAELLLAQLAHQPPPGLDQAALRAQQRQRTTKALTVSGSIVIVFGTLSLAAGIVGLVMRGVTGFQLDQAGGRDGLIQRQNPYSAEETARLRSTYNLGGRLAFGGLIAGGVLLPVGVTLRVVGGKRLKKDARTQQSLAIAPGSSLLRLEF